MIGQWDFGLRQVILWTVEQGVLLETWEIFWRDRCRCHRARLIEHYLPLAQKAEASVKRRLTQADPDDVTSWAALGLVRAVDRWDPEYGSSFESYALGSIRGVAIDEARSIDWVPRSVRRKQREMDRATEALETILGRAPTDEEISAELAWTNGDVTQARRATETAFVKSLDEETSREDEERSPRHEHIEDVRAPDPARAAVVEDAARQMVEYIRSLPPRSRLLVTLYYYEGLRLADVGRVLGITEGKAGLLHADVVEGIFATARTALT